MHDVEALLRGWVGEPIEISHDGDRIWNLRRLNAMNTVAFFDMINGYVRVWTWIGDTAAVRGRVYNIADIEIAMDHVKRILDNA